MIFLGDYVGGVTGGHFRFFWTSSEVEGDEGVFLLKASLIEL